MIDFIYTKTSDEFQLQGVHFEPKNKKDLCLLIIHGMSWFIVENKYGIVVGKNLSKKGTGVVYSHNRGYTHINDISTTKKTKDGGFKTKRIGAIYERFSECEYDIDAWIKTCLKLGYKRIVLFGHSLAGPKTIYYLHKHQPKKVVGHILASSGDMVGLVKNPGYQPDYLQLLKEAKQNIKRNKPRKILTGKIWDWYKISSQTFLDYFEDGCPADVFPVLRNPKIWTELASIKIPILCFYGEYDDTFIKSIKEDMGLIESKATSCPNFTKHILKLANHNYVNQEDALSEFLYDWIKKI